MKISLLFLLICVAAATATEVEQPEQDVALPVETSFDDIEPVSEQEYNEDEIPADEDKDDELNKDMDSWKHFRSRPFHRHRKYRIRRRRSSRRGRRSRFRRSRDYSRYVFGPHDVRKFLRYRRIYRKYIKV